MKASKQTVRKLLERMPQNRRKVAFSGKKKKDQLALKRQMKTSQKYLKATGRDSHDDGETTEDTEFTSRKLMEQPFHRASGSAANGGRNKNVNRYNLQFYQESKKELEQMRLEAYKPFEPVSPQQREVDASYFHNYDFPVRPEWSCDMDKEMLDRNENRYFREYVDQLQKLHKNKNQELSLFELNLETWRQLWRVLEISDILLIIVDVRYATLMYPPALYKHVVQTLKKHAILVLNKVDLVAPEVVVAWRCYFKEAYPGLPVILFASYPAKPIKSTAHGRLAHKRSIESVHNIYRECQKIVQSEVDLSTWEQKILEDMRTENVYWGEEPDSFSSTSKSAECTAEATEDFKIHPRDQPHVMYRDGVLTVGCVGFPNVGKSSLINALKGRKVVSVSRTPGHTKHFQTIFLTSALRLCDCPGLVFPSATPKHLQVLLGSYPISQLQVPYRSLKFMAEHLDVPQLLKLHLPEDYDKWSPAAVSDAWALKRGFLTAKAARPDRYRAANHLLRLCLAGQQQMILQFYPPGYHEKQDKWLQHSEVDEVKRYQNTQPVDRDGKEETSSVNSESVDSDESKSSNDESDADEEVEEEAEVAVSKSRNAFALLEDD